MFRLQFGNPSPPKKTPVPLSVLIKRGVGRKVNASGVKAEAEQKIAGSVAELLNVKIFLYSYIPDFSFFNEAEGIGAIYFQYTPPPLPEIKNKNPTTESTVSCVSL